jgi:hypothetical protein
VRGFGEELEGGHDGVHVGVSGRIGGSKGAIISQM